MANTALEPFISQISNELFPPLPVICSNSRDSSSRRLDALCI
ncbi:hypothetical protein [Ruminiclostridium cellobioparum]|nr:hypothetical protein [Ruminiclostridium cellobioparum]